MDRIGKKFWKLTIISETKVFKWWRNRVEVECKCECGNIVTRNYDSLWSKFSHCWCLWWVPKAQEYVWQQFWDLTILEVRSGENGVDAVYSCVCWSVKVTSIYNIKWWQKNCGCKRWETGRLWKTRPYKIRSHMKASCDNPNYHAYHRRGAKGITYPPERATFTGWRSEQEKNYSDKLYFTRDDTFANYSRENCVRKTAYSVSHLDLF
jgi:hypothetical protein